MMNFFSFGRKPKPERKDGYLLESIPLFSSLTPEEQSLIDQHSRLVGFKRGDIVYQEGTAPDAFYIIISGRFRLFTQARGPEPEATLLYFYRGEHFGETSLLTGNVHSASVEAKTDAVALKICAENFHKLLKEIPSLAIHLSRSLGRHLTREELGHSRHRREVRVAAFYAAAATGGMVRFIIDLLQALKKETHQKILLLDLSDDLKKHLPPELKRQEGVEFDLKGMDPSLEGVVRKAICTSETSFDYLAFTKNEARDLEEKKFVTLLTYLTYHYDYLMLYLPHRHTPVAVKALNYSDRVYLWAEKQADVFSFASRKVTELCQDFGFSKNEIKIILPMQEGKDFPAEGKESMPEMRLFSMLPSLQSQRYRYERTLTFLAREWSERLVGLVLGSGAAYGLAHIGVLRVFEEEKIPVDIIAGSSIGALIGGLWGAGYDSYEIENVAKSVDRKNAFFKILGFSDMSAFHRGFFKGNQVVRFLEKHLKNVMFKDLKIPVKMMATDLLTSEEVVLDSGSVLNAIRSSISIPGFFRPTRYKGSYLIDGGIVDPLPVRILAEMGVRRIIAVNVLPGPKDLIERNETRRRAFYQSLQRERPWNRMMNKFWDRFRRHYTTNIFNVLMNSIMFGSFEVARMEGEGADVFIHACVPDAHWIEFFSADKFIQEGMKKTREQLADIRQLLLE